MIKETFGGPTNIAHHSDKWFFNTLTNNLKISSHFLPSFRSSFVNLKVAFDLFFATLLYFTCEKISPQQKNQLLTFIVFGPFLSSLTLSLISNRSTCKTSNIEPNRLLISCLPKPSSLWKKMNVSSNLFLDSLINCNLNDILIHFHSSFHGISSSLFHLPVISLYNLIVCCDLVVTLLLLQIVI